MPNDGAQSVGKNELLFNVKDFGAVGDGGTSDSAAINAAGAAAGAAVGLGPAVVYFPYTSTGHASGALVMPAGVQLRGDRRVKIKKVGASNATFITISGDAVSIEGLTFDANGLATTRIIQIAANATRVGIRGCVFNDASHLNDLSGIETREGTSDIWIRDNLFDGVDTPVWINRNPLRCTVEGNRIINWKRRGIYVIGDATWSTTDLRIIGNHISD